MGKAGLKDQIQGFIQVSVSVGECLDNNLKHVSNFRAFNDRADLFDSFNSSMMHFFVRVIEDFSQNFDDLGQIARNLLGGAESHIS